MFRITFISLFFIFHTIISLLSERAKLYRQYAQRTVLKAYTPRIPACVAGSRRDRYLFVIQYPEDTA